MVSLIALLARGGTSGKIYWFYAVLLYVKYFHHIIFLESLTYNVTARVYTVAYCVITYISHNFGVSHIIS